MVVVHNTYYAIAPPICPDGGNNDLTQVNQPAVFSGRGELKNFDLHQQPAARTVRRWRHENVR
jgi:hypothetical protein